MFSIKPVGISGVSLISVDYKKKGRRGELLLFSTKQKNNRAIPSFFIAIFLFLSTR